MIKTQKSVPQIYYNRSRDFQVLGRIYDAVFNYLKSGTELIGNSVLNKNTDDELMDLVSLTLGFKHAHSYNIEQLKAICSIFMLAIRNKGSMLAIKLAIYSVLHSANIDEEPTVMFDNNTNTLSIYLSSQLEDITLLLDLFDYILPAGVSIKLYRKSINEGAVIVEKYSNMSKDKIGGKLVSTSRYVGIVPKKSELGDISQADLGWGRNDSMTVPTHKEAELVEREPSEE